MKSYPVMLIRDARAITGGLTQTSKMPCKSYSLPTLACHTGSKMAKVPGSICSTCYANKGFYSCYAATIEPAQHARLVSLDEPHWALAMVRLIGDDRHFRWHDSGDLQSVEHLEKIVLVAMATPNCQHWLPTREYAMVARYIAKHGKGAIPQNLVIRLSAMFPDQPVKVPASLQGIAGIAVSNVHAKQAPVGEECQANRRGGKCGDCRACWSRDVAAVSYRLH